MKEVSGNLLDCEYDVIAHQTNCTTRGPAKGLAADIFRKFPYADTYKKRKNTDFKHEAGTVELMGDGKKQRFVANMYAQYEPGKIKRGIEDTIKKRQKWFTVCLQELHAEMKVRKLTSVAFPYQIGCGLARGNWPRYKKMLKSFAKEAERDGITTYLITF